jgi:Plavaka transposase
MPPPRREAQAQGDWAPFHNEVQFELADFLFRDAELSASKVDTLLSLWTRSLSEFDEPGPMKDHRELHTLIDSSLLGNVPWQCMVTTFNKDSEDSVASPWTQTTYEIWYRDPETVVSNMLANPDFDGQFDFRPYVDLDEQQRRRWSNVMSGNIAWRHSVSRTPRNFVRHHLLTLLHII